MLYSYLCIHDSLNMINGCILNKAPCLEHLLELRFTLDLKWNAYILSITKNAGKMSGSLFFSRKYLSLPAMFCLYKGQIRPKMRYCCHIWTEATKSSHSSLDRVHKQKAWNKTWKFVSYFKTQTRLDNGKKILKQNKILFIIKLKVFVLMIKPFFILLIKLGLICWSHKWSYYWLPNSCSRWGR